MAGLDALRPPLRVGERVSLRLTDPARDLIGFVVALDPLRLEDRHGRPHVVAPGTVLAARRVGVALGRDPRSAPRELLDELALRAGLSPGTGMAPRTGMSPGTGLAGEPELHRISDLLAGRTPPPDVFAERREWRDGELCARVEGEWLTTNVTDPELLIELAWWASRQNARSIQVRR